MCTQTQNLQTTWDFEVLKHFALFLLPKIIKECPVHIKKT